MSEGIGVYASFAATRTSKERTNSQKVEDKDIAESSHRSQASPKSGRELDNKNERREIKQYPKVNS